jgi:phage-related protein
MLTMLRERGNALKRPYVDLLRDHIWELRVKCQAGQVRLLYFFFDGHRIIITHGFVKKQSAVPPAEIDRAIAVRAAYYANAKKGKLA